MKKLLLSFSAALLAAASLSAQMMPDSTVQVVAYWEVGDKIDYTMTERVYRMDEEGNETQTSSVSEALHFEVTEATDSTYTLRVRVDERSGGEEELTLRILTSNLGTFLEGEAALSPLFFYHGARLDMDKTYTLELPYTNIFGNGAVTLENRFQVDRELTDEYSVVLRSEAEADEKPLSCSSGTA